MGNTQQNHLLQIKAFFFFLPAELLTGSTGGWITESAVDPHYGWIDREAAFIHRQLVFGNATG